MAIKGLAYVHAEVTDMAEVLRTLCDIAARQCHGTGAAVLRMTGSIGRKEYGFDPLIFHQLLQ